MTTFAVSKIRLDCDGNVAKVYWSVVDLSSNEQVSAEVLAPVREVVDAIQAGDDVVALFDSNMPARLQERRFVVVQRGDGPKSVGLRGPTIPMQELCDMQKLDR
ncbi:MAG: hypothetical protein H7Y19_17720 [Luteimonas sp.]|nr:hypothetical protein [Luteimonas sp.]